MTPATYKNLRMSDDEWRHIKTLVDILHPFASLTQSLSRHDEPTINLAFPFYNIMFNHLEDSIDRFEDDDLLSDVLARACSKLQHYYSETENEYGFYYNLGTILDLWFKLSFYDSDVSETTLFELTLHGIH